MLGRATELGPLCAALDGLAEGRGGSHLLTGEAGIGKSWLLDQLVDEARRRDLTVVRATGAELESELTWSALADLLRPLAAGEGNRIEAGEVPPALRAVLDPCGAAPAGDPFATAIATRDLVVAVADLRPLVLVVDDLHWVDRSSRQTIAYTARRLADDPVLLVAAQRPGHPTAGFDHVVGIEPLAPADARRMVETAGCRSEAVRDRLVAELGGNPLLLLQAAAGLTPEQRDGVEQLPVPLPLSGPGGSRWEQQLVGLEPAARLAVTVAAAAMTGQIATVLAALDQLGLDATDLEPAEHLGLLGYEGELVRFDHPLIRSAAYHGATAPQRRRAHTALADGLPGGDPRRAWHLAAAAVGPDEEAASALDRLGAEDLARGAPTSAAVAFERAARLTAHDGTKAIRLRRAAEALAVVADGSSVSVLLDRMDGLPAGPAEQARRSGLRGQVLAWQGCDEEAQLLLRQAADAVAATEPDHAVRLLLAAAAGAVRSIDVAGFLQVAEAAHQLTGRVDAGLALRAEVVHGFALLADGRIEEGQVLVGRYRELLDAEDVAVSAGFLAEVVAPCLAFLLRAPEAHDLLVDLEGVLRSRATIVPLIATLGARAMLEHGRSLPASMAASVEAMALADELGQPLVAQHAVQSLAITSALAGDQDRCTDAATWLLERGSPGALVSASLGPATLALTLGRTELAVERYEDIEARFGLGAGIVRWEPEYVETLLRVRRVDDARRVRDAIAPGTGPAAAPDAALARVDGLLVDGADGLAEPFGRSVAGFAAAANHVGEARAELAWGERLRRARRRAEARPHLERAIRLFAEVGARPWQERAETELLAAGGVPAHRGLRTHELLSSQELQVARAAAGGASNREVASGLFISPRTVETHLSAVFRKLGLRNRSELAARAVEDPSLRS